MADRARTFAMIRRLATIAALSVWLGFITWYGVVVVPAGGQVLGSAAAQGFVTRVVTARLNLIAIAALAVLAWNVIVARRRRWLAAVWLAMVAAQVALGLLHGWVDALLDPAAHRVIDHDAFYGRHRVYLLVTTAQWLAAFVYTGLALALWREEDRAA